MNVCQGDPLLCIDFVVLFIGAFLSDWTTLAMLAVLLGLLLKLKADQKKARAADYARQLMALDDQRQKTRHQHIAWVVEDGQQTKQSK